MTLEIFFVGEKAGVAAALNNNFTYLLSLIQQGGIVGTAVGNATGFSVAAAFSLVNHSGAGAAIGTSAATAVGFFLNNSEMVGTATGTSTATGVTNELIAADGTATGTSQAAAIGTSNANVSTTGVGIATGNSTAAAVSNVSIDTIGTATGTSTAAAVSIFSFSAVGTATGTSTAIGQSPKTTESAEGTILTQTTQTIFASNVVGSPPTGTLNTFTLTANPGQVVFNTQTDTSLSNIVELYYHNHDVYAETNAGIWQNWISSGVWSTGTTISPVPVIITESPTGSIVTSTSQTIYASSTPGAAAPAGSTVGHGLNAFTITANPGQVSINSGTGFATDAATSNVIELYYQKHTLWQENSSQTWFDWVSPGVYDSNTLVSPIPSNDIINIASLPNQQTNATFVVSGTLQGYAGLFEITPSNGSFTDSQGNVYSIDAGSNAIENGQPMPDGGNTGAMTYYNGVVYGQDATSLSWFTWNGTTFVAATTNPPVAPSSIPTLQYQDNQTGSWLSLPSNLSVTSATFSFVHPPVSTTNSAMTVGVRDAGQTTVSALSNQFQVFVTGVTTLQSVSLSDSFFTASSPSGSLVGAVNVAVSGSSFNGTLSLSGTDASSFALSGSNLNTAAVLAARTYNLNIVATQSNAGGSPFTQAVSVIGMAALESAEGTTVTASSQIIYASRTTAGVPAINGPFDTWTITAVGGQVVHNAVSDGTTTGVSRLYYHLHTVYRNAGTSWWTWSGESNGTGGAWATTTDPRPTAKVVAVETVPAQPINTTFLTYGTLQNYTSIPTLQYQDNAGNWQPLPAGATRLTDYSFNHPTVAAADGAFTISIRDANTTTINTTTNAFQVYDPAGLKITAITLDTTNFVATPVAADTNVAAITVITAANPPNPFPGNGVGTGLLTLSGADAAHFVIIGNNLHTSATTADPSGGGSGTGGAYAITITASMAN